MKNLGFLLAALSFFMVSCSTTDEVPTDDLRAPFSDNKGQIDNCYKKVMKKQPNIGEGTVEMKFAINADGNAYKTIFMKKRSTLSNKMLNACIKKVVHSWQFPTGNAIELVYPFAFTKQMSSLSSESQASEPKPVDLRPAAAQESGNYSDLDVIDTSPPDDESGDSAPTPEE